MDQFESIVYSLKSFGADEAGQVHGKVRRSLNHFQAPASSRSRCFRQVIPEHFLSFDMGVR